MAANIETTVQSRDGILLEMAHIPLRACTTTRNSRVSGLLY